MKKETKQNKTQNNKNKNQAKQEECIKRKHKSKQIM